MKWPEITWFQAIFVSFWVNLSKKCLKIIEFLILISLP